MKGKAFTVLESRMDAVIGLINLLLKLSKQRLCDGGEPFQIFKGANVLVKHLLITEILAMQMNCGVGFLCSCHRIISYNSRSSQNRHGG